VLEKEGYEVETFATGRAGIARLEEVLPHLLLVDLKMPELDGFQVLERLRQDEALRHVPVIMISAVDEMPSVVRAIELGAADYLPKPFNAVLLKARVGATLEKKRLADAERLHARSLERELEIGRQIQASFLPEELPQPPGWEIAASFHPARKVGGDFYDAFLLPRSGRLGLAVSDVCDKGVGAALFMAVFRSLIRTAIERDDEAGAEAAASVEAAAARNSDYIARTHGKANMFATLFLAVLDLGSGALTYVNAGHEPPVVRRASGALARLPPTGPAVGLLPGLSFRVDQTKLSRGDMLLAFTDGVSEARNSAGELYGEGRVLALLEGSPASAPALLSRVEESLRGHTAGGEPSDDITMLAVRRME
jgi:serine phosphatase RsbU (regulator of sigma subunit)